jgi:hypothetical protein
LLYGFPHIFKFRMIVFAGIFNVRIDGGIQKLSLFA